MYIIMVLSILIAAESPSAQEIFPFSTDEIRILAQELQDSQLWKQRKALSKIEAGTTNHPLDKEIITLLLSYIHPTYNRHTIYGVETSHPEIRARILRLLTRKIDTEIYQQLRRSLQFDKAPIVRAAASELLATYPLSNYSDFSLISYILLKAVHAGNAGEVSRLLISAEKIAQTIYQKSGITRDEPAFLLTALPLIVNGPYSATLRTSAKRFLEDRALK